MWIPLSSSYERDKCGYGTHRRTLFFFILLQLLRMPDNDSQLFLWEFSFFKPITQENNVETQMAYDCESFTISLQNASCTGSQVLYLFLKCWLFKRTMMAPSFLPFIGVHINIFSSCTVSTQIYLRKMPSHNLFRETSPQEFISSFL